MQAAARTLALIIGVTLWAAGCGPTQPAPIIVDDLTTAPAQTPATAPELTPTSTTTPPAAFAPGNAKLTVAGTLFEPCIPPPSGCTYDITLQGPHGAVAVVPLDYTGDYAAQSEGRKTAMHPGPGLPATLAPGDYVLAFQSFAWSDAASPVPLPSGGMGYLPEVREGCRRAFTIRPTDASIRLRVTWHDIRCTVKVTRA